MTKPLTPIEDAGMYRALARERRDAELLQELERLVTRLEALLLVRPRPKLTVVE